MVTPLAGTASGYSRWRSKQRANYAPPLIADVRLRRGRVPALSVIVMIMGIVVAGLGFIGLVAPTLLLDIGKSLLTESGLYAVAVVRVAFGLLLLLVARVSRMPRTIRVIGIVIIIAGLITPVFGLQRFASMFNWLSIQGSALIRVMAMFAVAFGALVVYAVIPRPRSSL